MFSLGEEEELGMFKRRSAAAGVDFMGSQQQTGAPLSTVGVRKRVNKSASG
jgi:hypothetical protein